MCPFLRWTVRVSDLSSALLNSATRGRDSPTELPVYSVGCSLIIFSLVFAMSGEKLFNEWLTRVMLGWCYRGVKMYTTRRVCFVNLFF